MTVAGSYSVVEAVGTQEAMMQVIRSTGQGEHVGFVGVSHGVELPGEELFFAVVHLHGGTGWPDAQGVPRRCPTGAED